MHDSLEHGAPVSGRPIGDDAEQLLSLRLESLGDPEEVAALDDGGGHQDETCGSGLVAVR
jgi:hypothetical protein